MGNPDLVVVVNYVFPALVDSLGLLGPQELVIIFGLFKFLACVRELLGELLETALGLINLLHVVVCFFGEALLIQAFEGFRLLPDFLEILLGFQIVLF